MLMGVWMPFLGTALGAACVFLLRDGLGERVNRALLGFASGVMVAASVWSLLIPAMEQSEAMGRRQRAVFCWAWRFCWRWTG